VPQFVDTAIVSLRSVLRSCDAALAAITAVLDFFWTRLSQRSHQGRAAERLGRINLAEKIVVTPSTDV